MKTLHSAAEEGDIEFLKKALSKGIPLDSPDRYNQTPLIHAARKKKIGALKFLITHGADINAKTSHEGLTSLHLFAMAGALKICRFLIENGADIHTKDNYDRGVLELVCTAEDRKRNKEKKREERLLLIRYLYDKGAEIGYALHKAAYYGHINIIHFLIQEGADPDALNKKGKTPLHEAVYADQPEAVRVLLENGADPLKKDSNGNSLLHVLRYKSKTIGDMLLAEGLSINAKNREGQTPLFRAISGPEEFFNFCIQNHADPEAVDKSGSTPLHMASIKSNPDAIKVLLEKGVKVNPLDKDHRTPFDYAGGIGDNTAGYHEFMLIDLCKAELKKYGGKSGKRIKTP